MNLTHLTTQLHDGQIEQETIGILLQRPDFYDDIGSIVNEKDFYFKEHEILFAAIRILYSRNMFDYRTLTKLLAQRNVLQDIGGEEYITGLMNCVSSVHVAKFNAERIKQFSNYRKGMRLSQEIVQLTEERPKDYVKQITELFTQFDAVEGSQMGSLADALKAKKETMQQGIKASPVTGFTKLDSWMRGIGTNRLIVVAGRPGTGKTALALSITRNVAKQTYGPPIFFSMEMEKDELTSRMLADVSGVSYSLILRNELDAGQQEIVETTSKKLAEHDYYLDDKAKMDLHYISTQARKLKREKGKIGVIVVDYLTLMDFERVNGENKSDALGKLTKGLKQLAREIGCSVILLCQMNRAIESRGGKDGSKRPTLSDLKDSGSIEQDADSVIFLHRNDEKTEDYIAHIDMYIEKGRQTGQGEFAFRFNGAIQRYTEVVT